MLARELVHHRFPDHTGIYTPAEHLVAELKRPDLLVLRIDDIQCHGRNLTSRGYRPEPHAAAPRGPECPTPHPRAVTAGSKPI